MAQRWFGSKHGSELKLFSSIFLKLNQSLWSSKPMWHCKYSVILESEAKFDETHMKMSKYKNSVFPYSVHSTVNLAAWKLKQANVTLMSFRHLFAETITPERKVFFFKIIWQMLSKLTKSVRNYQHPILWRNHQNWNLFFRNFLLKYKSCMNDKELLKKEQKICTNFFFFYVLNELSPKIFP